MCVRFPLGSARVTGLSLLCLLLWLAPAACSSAPTVVAIENEGLRIEFDGNLHSRLTALADGREEALGEFAPSEFLMASDGPLTDFSFQTHTQESIRDSIGPGMRHVITGLGRGLQKRVTLTTYPDIPATALFQITYTNGSGGPVVVEGWTANAYHFASAAPVESAAAPFWSYQPASYESRPDWILPLKPGFAQPNFMGMNATDYGSGTPVADIWRPDLGLAVGLLELTPQQLSLPIEMPEAGGARLRIESKARTELAPGAELTGPVTFVTLHRGDYFNALSTYRSLMLKRGIEFQPFPQTAYQPIWCAWGYEREFTLKQVTDTLPKVRELGFDWAVLDDGWQTAEGDWYPDPRKFPRGDADMAAFVDRIHQQGLKAKLWWVPLAVDPDTDLIRNQPELLLQNADGSRQLISWWDAFYLCPKSPEVREYTRRLVQKILGEWGYDGLKIDGQHLNGAPPCYNPEHHHAYPEEAAEAVPAFFQLIYDTARAIKPDAVVEICPCGATTSFLTMPFMNQPVASDPESSWQIRLKGKTFKALMGPDVPYYGDHVELSDGGSDFASTIGIGAVLGTKFTWPLGARSNPEFDLTPEREQRLKQWLQIYREKDLPHGRYRGELYDLGFDRPEAHAIQKGDAIYYAFFAETFDSTVELRGLAQQEYTVIDYVSGNQLGTVQGPTAVLPVQFHGSLLLEATPLQ